MGRLETVKVGDMVVEFQGHFRDASYATRIVARLTATQVVTDDEKRWRKSNGRRVGGYGWRECVEPLTPETQRKMDAIDAKKALRELQRRIARIRMDTVRKMEMDDLHTIADILDKYEMAESEVSDG